MPPIQINSNIPGYLKEPDLHILAKLAQQVPEKGVIIDVGCGWGREAWVFSKNAPASVQIFCLDIWGEKPVWEYLQAPKENLTNSFDEFSQFTQDCHNITPIHVKKRFLPGEWPYEFKADLIFYDDEDTDENLILPRLTFWLEHLKPGGILCGADYYPYSQPRVKTGVFQAVGHIAMRTGRILHHHPQTCIWMLSSSDIFPRYIA